MKNKIQISVFMLSFFLLFFAGVKNIQATEITIPANTDDQSVYSNGNMQWIGYASHKIGAQYNISAVLPFELPTLAAGETISTAELRVYLEAVAGGLGNHVDVYGLPYRSTSTVLSSDFFAGDYGTDASATALQDDIFTLSTTNGQKTTNCSEAFANFINAQYTAGAVGGDFIFIRLGLDVSNSANYDYWTISSQDATTAANRPVLTLTTENGVNTAPILATIGAQNVQEGTILNVNISANDVDGDALSLSASNLPSFATFTDNVDGTAVLALSPQTGDAATYNTTISVSDGSETVSETISIVVSEYVVPVDGTYYCDPINGSMSNSGTQASPWKSLQDVFSAKKTFNSGDVIYLLSGAHGSPYITGTHSDYVTIKPLAGENPVIASIQVESASYWAFDGVSFSTDGSGGSFARDYMFSSKDNATYLKIENCTFSSGASSANWSKSDWYANAEDAVIIRGDNIIFNNNTIKNTYFALQIEGDYAEVKNNLIDNFGADAIRALGSHAIYDNNIIRDAYVEDYGINHDDGIQMYDKDNVAAGVIEDVTISNNTILEFADPITQAMIDDGLVGYSMQGIIITDGHTENVDVNNNLVVSDHYHGITLTGAVNCKIQNNTVVKTPTSYNPTSDATPWIQVKDDKQGNASTGNIIRNNIAAKYTPWTYVDVDNTTENNVTVTAADSPNCFVDYAGFDFHLKAGSIAIDAGVNTNLSATDIEGNPRSVGSAVDCGAYELQSGSDVTAPTISVANNTYFNDEFTIVFSESVTQASAENTSNYSLDNGAGILTASLDADNKTVTLTTSALTGNILYSLTANNVKDFAGNQSSNASASLTYKCDVNWASTYQDDQWGLNPPANAFDGDLATKWAAEGTEWIQKSFCESTTIQSVDIAFATGDARSYSFIIEVSPDGRSFTQAFSGASSGTSTALENFDFSDVSAKYVRITGSGSDVNDWNNYSEIVINTDGSTPPPTNNAPVLAAIGNQTLYEGETLNVNVSATDADGDALTYSTVNLPAFATFTDNGDGTAVLNLAPQTGDASMSNIIIEVSDGTDTDDETVTVNVNEVVVANNAPVLAAIGNQTLNEGETLNVNVSATDADGDILYLTATNLPSFATFTDSGDGTAVLAIAPQSGDASTSNITVSVNDGTDTDTETISVTVNELIAAQTYTLVASADDQAVSNNGSMQWVGYQLHRIGTNKNTVAVIPFKLPTLAAGETITSADFSAYLISKAGGLANTVDLYALPYRSSSTILTSDFYAGSFGGDASATALQADFLTISSGTTTTHTSSCFSELADYLNAQYSAGAVGGDFIFIRLNMNAADASNYNYWDIASQDATNASQHPVLSFETGGQAKSVLAISENIINTDELTFTVYPNPNTNGNVNIRFNGFDDSEKTLIRVFELSGQLIYQKEINSQLGESSLNLSSEIKLKSGMYLINIDNKSIHKHSKLIVK